MGGCRNQVRKEARRLRHCGGHGALETSNAACGGSKGIIRCPQISQPGKCCGNLGGPRIEAPMVGCRNQVRKEARRLSDCGFDSLGKSEWAEKSWPAPQVMSGG